MKPGPHRRRIAVIGAGITGLSAAWLLRDVAAPVLFEVDSRAGGHADTQEITLDGRTLAVDTGFIVYNERNYPNLTGLFDTLGVQTRRSDMSFGVSVGNGRLEYASGELLQVFAQRRNVLRPRFWSMLRDITRFYREAPALLAERSTETLGAYLDRNRYGRAFAEDHLLPMGAAIWSASVQGMRAFPARHFVRFFHNHGLLSLSNRPAWRTVCGGARQHVARLARDLPELRLSSGVRGVVRDGTGVILHLHDGQSERFDQAILACHADQALALLAAPSAAERAVLGAISCQDNLAVLHTDAALMPRRRGAWSAWNYLSDENDHARAVCVTYWMNRLQGLHTRFPLLVTLNPLRAPDPRHVLLTRRYRHPQFDVAAMVAQDRLADIQGAGGVWFAGAWTGWGFHEDAITSAVQVATALGATAPWRGARSARAVA